MPDVNPYPYIWCENCDAIQPVLWDDLPADEQHDRPALDLVCGVCSLIIATLHQSQQAPLPPGGKVVRLRTK
jgi:hypothetical protein